MECLGTVTRNLGFSESFQAAWYHSHDEWGLNQRDLVNEEL